MIESFIARTQKFKEKGRIDVCVRCLASERGKKKMKEEGAKRANRPALGTPSGCERGAYTSVVCSKGGARLNSCVAFFPFLLFV